MKTQAEKVAPPLPCRFTPARPNLLQRKCACGGGGASGMTGKCEECDSKHLTGLQTKLAINRPGDHFEQEADHVADRVMRMPEQVEHTTAPHLQRQTISPVGLAAPTAGDAAAPPIVQQVLDSHGHPLDAQTRSFMESRFGHDFSRVRIHADARAAESARAVDALAYTLGHDVVFAEGQYAPGTNEGRRLLTHELVHVVQQGQVIPTPSMALTFSALTGQSESEADLEANQIDTGVRTLSLSTVSQRRIQRQPTAPGGGAVPSWLEGVSVVRHVQGDIYEIELTGYGRTLVGPYSQLDSYLSSQGLGEDAHHIVGGEHLKDVSSGFTYNNAPAVALERGLHRTISSRITAEQKYLGGRHGGRPSVTSRQVAGLYRRVYTRHTSFRQLATVADNILGTTSSPASSLQVAPQPGTGKGVAGAVGQIASGVALGLLGDWAKSEMLEDLRKLPKTQLANVTSLMDPQMAESLHTVDVLYMNLGQFQAELEEIHLTGLLRIFKDAELIGATSIDLESKSSQLAVLDEELTEYGDRLDVISDNLYTFLDDKEELLANADFAEKLAELIANPWIAEKLIMQVFTSIDQYFEVYEELVNYTTRMRSSITAAEKLLASVEKMKQDQVAYQDAVREELNEINRKLLGRYWEKLRRERKLRSSDTSKKNRPPKVRVAPKPTPSMAPREPPEVKKRRAPKAPSMAP